jgi:medium-chain acyl-[acyl-carrier-protein] hydrolase
MGWLTQSQAEEEGQCQALVRWEPVAEPRMRLFCLPHAGGGSGTYLHWAQRLAPDIEVIAIRLPGRESRLGEPPLRTISDIVAALLTDIPPWLDRPHAWFGHSFGALIAYETCRALRRAQLPGPARLLASSRRAPHLPPLTQPVHRAPVHEFVQRLRDLNGTPLRILEDQEAMASLLPILRADFAAVETYTYQPAPPLDCPISVYGGQDDPSVTIAGLQAWKEHTSASCSVRVFPGGHFFLHSASETVLSLIATELGSAPNGFVTPQQ